MAGYDYSIALTAFFASYCFFEVPANLMLKVRAFLQYHPQCLI